MNKITAALVAGIALVVGTYFSVANELITAPVVVASVLWIWKYFIFGFKSILIVGAGWSATEIYKKTFVEPVKYGDGTFSWQPFKRLFAGISTGISFVVGEIIGFLSFLGFNEKWDWEGFINWNIWLLVLIGLGIFAYDTFAKRIWPMLWKTAKDDAVIIKRDSQGKITGIKDLSEEDPKTEIIDRTEPKEDTP